MQSLVVVVTVIRIVPPNDTLAQQGKPGDMAVGGVDVAAYLSYFTYLHFNITHTLTFIYNNTYHTTNNKQQ